MIEGLPSRCFDFSYSENLKVADQIEYAHAFAYLGMDFFRSPYQLLQQQ